MRIYYNPDTGQIVHWVRDFEVYWDRFVSESRGNRGERDFAENVANQPKLLDLVDTWGKVDADGDPKYSMNQQLTDIEAKPGWVEAVPEFLEGPPEL